MNERIEPNSIEGHYRALSILNLAFVAGLTMFSLITWFLAPTHIYTLNVTDPFTLMAILLIVTTVPIGHFIFEKRKAEARAASEPEEKVFIYRKGYILRCATLEGPALFTVICAFLTNVAVYYLFMLIPLVLLIAARPASLAAFKQQIGVTD